MNKKVTSTIAEWVSEAYEIGYAHGVNPLRKLEGKSQQRVNQTWEACADRLVSKLSPMLKLEQKRKPDGTRRSDWEDRNFCAQCQKPIPKNRMLCKNHALEIDRISGGFFSNMRALEAMRQMKHGGRKKR